MSARLDRPHFVYRCYDADRRLVYVGCTVDLFPRLRTHQLNSWWADQTVRVKAAVAQDQRTGRLIEKQTIRIEHPRWNVKHRWPADSTWTRDHFKDLAYATLRYDGLQTPHSPQLLRICREFEKRYGEPMRDPRIDSASWESGGPCSFADVEQYRDFLRRRATPSLAVSQ